MTQQTFDWAFKGEAFNNSANISPYEWAYFGEYVNLNLATLPQFLMMVSMIYG